MSKILYFIFLIFSITCFSQALDATLIEINYGGDANPDNLARVDNKLFFTAKNVNDYGLWVHDQITEETYFVKAIFPNNGDRFSSSNFRFYTKNEILYFLVKSPNGVIELWRSNGTDLGTYRIKVINTYQSDSLIDSNFFFEYNNMLFFNVNDGVHGFELWRTDGTETGTTILKDINPSTIPSFVNVSKIIFFNDKFFFSANDGVNGRELWSSDGTEAGTTILKDINIGSAGSDPDNFFVFNNELFFTAYTENQDREIWKTDGTTDGTIILKDINPTQGSLPYQESDVLIFGNHFYFYANDGVHGFELWKSDGTTHGTQLFKDINVGYSSSSDYTKGIVVNDYFLFTTNVNYFGFNLWKSDGTNNGTVLLKSFQITPMTYFETNYFTPVLFDEEVYFLANDNVLGRELWKTNGTVAGTTLVKDINPGNRSSEVDGLYAFNNYLFLRANDGSRNYMTPWVSDGTMQGTFELSNYNVTGNSPREFRLININGIAYFQATTSLYGSELFKTDGTKVGTNIVKDINHGYSSSPRHFIKYNDKVVFTANNYISQNIAFITDGTIDGTKPIKNDYSYYTIPSNPANNNLTPKYTKAGNNVFFRAGKIGVGYELFKTDGTSDGTVLVKDIAIGNTSSISEYMLFMEYNGMFYFKADDQIHGEELWRSDGTEEGTYMVKDIYSGSYSGMSVSSNLFSDYSDNPLSANHKVYAKLNNLLYFSAEDSAGKGIFKTDGTESGTVKVIPNLSNESNSFAPSIINHTNNKIFYATTVLPNYGYSYNTLWSTDGTQEGSVRLLYSPMSVSNQFRKNTVFNNELYFSVKMSSEGESFYKSDGTISGTILLKDNLMANEYIRDIFSSGNYVYFTVSSSSEVYSQQLWRTDGRPEGTVLVESLAGSEYRDFYTSFIDINGTLFFLKYLTSNSIYNDFIKKIWYINDSMMTPDYVEINVVNREVNNYENILDLYAVENKMIFVMATDLGGTELYVTDVGALLGNNSFELKPIDTNSIDFKIYPNPSKGKFFIRNSCGFIIDDVEIFDLTGKSLLKEKINRIEGEINISNFSSGVYLIKIKSRNFSKIYKIVLG